MNKAKSTKFRGRMLESIQFKFDGGMSSNHELNFYEAGRFSYGAARWLYTLEKFRQDRKVISRLSTRVEADIRIRAPKRGSFLQEIIITAAPIIADCALKVPFEAMVAYAWDKISPPNTNDKELAVVLAKQEIEKEREKTKQFEIFAEVVSNNNATTQQTLSILDELVRRDRSHIVDGKEILREDLQLARDRTKAEVDRQQLIHEYIDQFSSLNSKESDLLAGQLRKSVPDMVLPLRSSATQLSIGGGSSKKSFAALDFKTGKAIGAQLEDKNREVWRGKLKSYDREQGTGKFRYDDYKNPISFRIPHELRRNLSPKIVQAMQMDTVLATVQFIRDNFGNEISMILWDLHPDEGED